MSSNNIMMQNRLQSAFVIKIPIFNDFDREIIRRKILKLQTIKENLFVKIKGMIENQTQYIIEYDNSNLNPLRSSPKQKQAQLPQSTLNLLPQVLKTNSINTRISIINIFISSNGDFLYFLNLKEFDISGKEESGLLEKVYTMEWETIVSIVNKDKKQEERKQIEPESPKSPRYLQHLRQASVSRLILESKSVSHGLSESKRFFTSSNKPQPKSKEDFNTLKTIEFKNILNMNQEYMHQFIDVLCDDNPANYTEASTKLCSKSTRSF